MSSERRTRRATDKSPKSVGGKKGVRRWEPHLAIPAAYMYSQGASDHEVAFGLGVTHPTITYWLKVHPEFRKAKFEAGRFVEARLANCMVQAAEGARRTEITEVWDEVEEVWKPRLRKTIELPPDYRAALAWLHARAPEQWQEKQQVVLEVDSNTAAILDEGRERMKEIIAGIRGETDG